MKRILLAAFAAVSATALAAPSAYAQRNFDHGQQQDHTDERGERDAENGRGGREWRDRDGDASPSILRGGPRIEHPAIDPSPSPPEGRDWNVRAWDPSSQNYQNAVQSPRRHDVNIASDEDRGRDRHDGDGGRNGDHDGDRDLGHEDRNGHDNGRDWGRNDWGHNDSRHDDDRYRRWRHTHHDFDTPRYRDWRQVRHGYYFDGGYARIVGGYYGHNYNWWGYQNWRRPHRRYVVGYVLPAYLYWEPVPYDLYYRLPPAPYGCRYVLVDRDILLIAISTGLILDALLYY